MYTHLLLDQGDNPGFIVYVNVDFPSRVRELQEHKSITMRY